MSAMQHQVAGDHYKNMAIQPLEYSHKNKFNPLQTHMVKYVSRYPFKNGAEDLRKLRHLVDIALFLEYGEEP